MTDKSKNSSNVVIDLAKYKQYKLIHKGDVNFNSDIWNIETNKKAAKQKIRFKINYYEIQHILCCMFNHIDFLTGLLTYETDQDRINMLKEHLSILHQIHSYLQKKLEESEYNAIFLNLTYYDFEFFLCVLESELGSHLNFSTGELEDLDGYDEKFIWYLRNLQTVYFRLKPKYIGIEDILHPGLSELRKKMKSSEPQGISEFRVLDKN